jgi:hypothetical protein
VNNLPFHGAGDGRLFRGNLHTHTSASDGGLSPEAVCAAYREKGYDFLAITDHFLEEFGYPVTDTTVFRDGEFTTLIGAELHAPALANGQDWHIVAAGLPLDFPSPSEGETGAMLAERAIQAGAFVGLAHPTWYGATVADLQTIPTAHAIEAYNEVCAVLSDRPESWFQIDQLLTVGHRVTVFAADDAHFRFFGDAPAAGDDYPAGFGSWVWVQADRLDPDLLVDSLKTGRFYTSQGPLIHDIAITDDRTELTVTTSPAVSVFVTGDPAIYTLAANHGADITETTASIAAFKDSFCRVTVVDAAGKRAWSNPIWLDNSLEK